MDRQKEKIKMSKSKIFLVFLSIIIFSIAVFSFSSCSGLLMEDAETGSMADETIVLEKPQLSDEQKRLLSSFGYPDEFVIIFDKQQEVTRVETWFYQAMESCFKFKNGEYIGYKRAITGDIESEVNDIRPEDFVFAMSPDMIKKLVGSQKVYEYTEPQTNFKLLIFEEKQLLCTFSDKDELINVIKSKKTLVDRY